MKICNQCKISKDDSEFYTHWNRKKTDRVLNSECKICKYNRQKDLRIKNRKPKIVETFRICKRCGELKPIESFQLKKNGSKKYAKGKLYRAKKCRDCINELWNIRNNIKCKDPDFIAKRKQISAKFKDRNRDRVREYARVNSYKFRNSDKYKEWRRNYLLTHKPSQVQLLERRVKDKYHIDKITEQYAKRLIKHSNRLAVITPEMINIKRSEIAIFRIKKLIKLLNDKTL
jgi:hypothetical protein